MTKLRLRSTLKIPHLSAYDTLKQCVEKVLELVEPVFWVILEYCSQKQGTDNTKLHDLHSTFHIFHTLPLSLLSTF